MFIALYEDAIEDSYSRVLDEKGKKFRTNLVDRGNQLVTKIGIVGIAHGKLNVDDDLVTMLVFEMLSVGNGGHRFKRATVTFCFHDTDD